MPEQTQELRMRMVAQLQDLYVALLIRRGGSTKAPISRSVCRPADPPWWQHQ
jgi:hypothetical protein